MYIPNDNCNTCLITMTTIGKMSGLIFRKSFYFICYVPFLCLAISISRYKFRIKSKSYSFKFPFKEYDYQNSLIKSKSTITKAGNFAGVASIDTYTYKNPTLKDIVMLQDLQTTLKYSCINHKFY